MFLMFSKKYLLRNARLKTESTIASIWEEKTKTTKKDKFNKNLYPPTVFEIEIQFFNKILWRI